MQDLNQYKGQTIRAKIIEINAADSRLILSRREVLNEERSAALARIFDELSVGDVIEGKVARMTNFGAFIDLGGVDGLVHVSEISHERVSQPSDVCQLVKKLRLRFWAWIQNVSVSHCQLRLLNQDLGIQQLKKAPAGTVLEGTVKRVVDFGAFVEVFPGVEGLVHVSQISHKHIANPSDVLTAGDKVQVKVLDVNPERQRLSWSIKALEEAPAREENDRPSSFTSPCQSKHQLTTQLLKKKVQQR